MYYDRDDRGLPLAWIQRMTNAIRVAASRFTADRMVRDYADHYYVPMMRGGMPEDDPPTG